ncbi:arylsulfatase [Porticoccus sp. GXU_MW_L64]
MKNRFTITLFFLFVAACTGGTPDVQEQEDKRPNILLIVADDLGYSDLGAYGSEIDTSNLDQLAQRGVRLTQFYATPACSTTRASLLTGTDYHLTGLGSLASVLAPNQKNQPGYEGYLNDGVVTLPELMREAGYSTYMSGKWHLGKAESSVPASRGFDTSFAMITGTGNHFDISSALGPGKNHFQENGKILEELPAGYYSTRTFTDKLIQQIDAGKAAGKPFFAYLTYSAPHWPLQAPESSIAKYRGRYDQGFASIQAERFSRQKQLGLISEEVEYFPSATARETWAGLNAEERKVETRRMEIYAAMVDDIDKQVGRLIAHLKEIGQYDNTYIVFMSDNGPEGRDIGRIRIKGETLDEWITSTRDNSYDNMGKADSYLWTGPHWAWASAAPLHGIKVHTHEGGIRVPAFVSHPGLPRDTITALATIKDIVPTFLELADASHPGQYYQGREIHPLQGRSLLPLLRGEAESVHDSDHVTGWEFLGRRALRKGDWKLVSPQRSGDPKWQLFNIANDPTELNDLAKEQPQILQKMVVAWEKYAMDNNIILPEMEKP